ncbi:MAG: hypothetical protein ACR2HP_18205 [Ilumatobacteraceae bacterium]
MKRRLSTIAAIVVAIGVLSGCPSNPSARTVAEDIIDGLDLPDERKTCLRAQLEETTDEDLRAVALGNENANFGSAFDDSTASEAWRAFVEKLATSCP